MLPFGLYNGSLHPCGPKTAIEKTSPFSSFCKIAPKAPHLSEKAPSGCLLNIYVDITELSVRLAPVNHVLSRLAAAYAYVGDVFLLERDAS